MRVHVHKCTWNIHVLMRDEKEERSKQGQTNKQGKATQHTQGSHFSTYMYMHVRGFESHPRQLIFLRKSDCLRCAVLLALFVCLTLLASFF